MKEGGGWATVEWSSKENAISPFDFRAINSDGAEVLIDAKSTSGEFGRVVHMSFAELTAAAKANRYDLWRVYAINDDGACLKIAESIGAKAQAILDGLHLPKEVTVDGVSIDPIALSWGPEIVIERPDDAPADG